MRDIVERLRKGSSHGVLIPCEDLTEAADEIERLRAEVERLNKLYNEERQLTCKLIRGAEQ